MVEVSLDEWGRLTLPSAVREQFGDHYHIVPLENTIKLIPIAPDPLEALRDEFADVETSATALRQEVRTAALDEPDT